MARRMDDSFRVLGPYPDGSRFRIIVIENGARKYRKFSTEDEARRAMATAVPSGIPIPAPKPAPIPVPKPAPIVKVPTKTIREALRDYRTYMVDHKGNKPGSAEQTLIKIRRFFPDLNWEVTRLDPSSAASLYEQLRTSPRKPQRRPREGERVVPLKPISVDYHRNILAETKTFFDWCVKKTWIATNPLAGVEGVGRRNHGKEQLRINEARKWISRAMELGREGKTGAIAAMMTLLMGMRSSEITSRVVRDVDDDGRLLWIPDSKTAKGRRTLQIPDPLRPLLTGLCTGKKSHELIFGARDRGWPRAWVQRICREVGVTVVTAHGQRGLHSTLAVEEGVTPRAVADALGHESFATTAQSYATSESVGNARSNRVQQRLAGDYLVTEVGAEVAP